MPEGYSSTGKMEWVAENVCGVMGHSIVTLTLENNPAQLVYEAMCSKCGMTLREIRGEEE